LVIFAGPVSHYTAAAAEQLANPLPLIEALMPDAGDNS